VTENKRWDGPPLATEESRELHTKSTVTQAFQRLKGKRPSEIKLGDRGHNNTSFTEIDHNLGKSSRPSESYDAFSSYWFVFIHLQSAYKQFNVVLIPGCSKNGSHRTPGHMTNCVGLASICGLIRVRLLLYLMNHTIHIISYSIVSYRIVSYHIVYRIVSYHIISYHIISYHIISHHIAS